MIIHLNSQLPNTFIVITITVHPAKCLPLTHKNTFLQTTMTVIFSCDSTWSLGIFREILVDSEYVYLLFLNQESPPLKAFNAMSSGIKLHCKRLACNYRGTHKLYLATSTVDIFLSQSKLKGLLWAKTTQTLWKMNGAKDNVIPNHEVTRYCFALYGSFRKHSKHNRWVNSCSKNLLQGYQKHLPQ